MRYRVNKKKLYSEGVVKVRYVVIEKGWYGNTYESTGVDNKVLYQPENKSLTLTYKVEIENRKEGWYGDTFESTGVDNEVASQPADNKN